MIIIDQEVKVIRPRSLEDGIDRFRCIEIAGRNCWRSEEKITEDSYRKFLENLRKRGHDSPMEFGDIMYDITTSRDVMAELTRHRHASFAIESQRYVNENKEGGIRFIRPLFYKPYDPFRDPADLSDMVYWASRNWDVAMEFAECTYNALLEKGMKNQDARKVLPNSTATRIVMKVNLRELLHIYDLRSSPAAYPEIRHLMKLLKKETDKVLPEFLPEAIE